MLLAIDVGNTRVKAAVFEENVILETYIFKVEIFLDQTQNILKKFPKIKHLIIASVGKLDEHDLKPLSKKVEIVIVSRDFQFPFQNLYHTPQTLGIDRLVLASGATLLFRNQNRLIIDAGTCITYDFVNNQNQYLGGAISPGIKLRYKSMNDYTAKLPLLETQNPENFIGKTTAESMHSGVIFGVIGEIEGFINRYQTGFSNFTIILTGGDAEFLAKRLKNTIFANSNFLLESLNVLFQYKIKND
ncbi:type III pantothenate kinase [Flavobacterium sp. NST-5]|uniref:Type III pantothenate kinase n=1 Tax=Flavobacterium ichthyis TaxID=2698827 RepID=A0ABW9Z910_9FLAO|nr:type III pantothenate kinase [Flavobacterium ichthyis]NBL64595.1 type III pantothenate kinase [Flavobacterium ichthyis]